jgi:co-chaperonin GroES (HSP10)
MKKPNFNPTTNGVLVQWIKEKIITAGGLAVPEGAASSFTPPKARVIAVGPGNHTTAGVLIPCDVREGHIVYIRVAADRSGQLIAPGLPIRLGTEDYILVREIDIIGIANDPESE